MKTTSVALVLGFLSTGPALAQGLRLNGPLAVRDGPGGSVESFVVVPGGQRVLYRADQDQYGMRELYSVPIDRSQAPVQLNPPLGNTGHVFDFRVSPDGARVSFLAYTLDGRIPLFSAPIDRVTAPLDLTGDLPGISSFEIAPSGLQVVFQQQQLGQNPRLERLLSVDITGASAPIELDGQLQHVQIDEHKISPDGSRVVYFANHLGAGAHRYLFSVPIDGSQDPVALTGSIPLPIVLPFFRISNDGTRVVYAFIGEGGVFTVPMDGSAPPVRLNTSPTTAVVQNFLLTPDSSRVVYTADQDVDGEVELFSVAIDGSAAPVQLNAPLVAGGHVFLDFELSPDGSRVVYRAYQELAGVFELYSAPIDGSAAPVKLNPSLGGARDVLGLAIGPDGATVVYRADQDTDGVVELYRAPIDGSQAAQKLSGTMLGVGVSEFRFTPDGASVLYLANQDRPFVKELYAVPSDGSAAAVRISPPLGAPPQQVFPGFAAGSDGLRAVFLADRDVAGTRELYSAPVDASAPALELNAPLVSGDATVGQVVEAAFAGDERFVYLADGDEPGVEELYSVSFEHDPPFVKLSGTLPPGGEVLAGTIRVSPDGSRVAYLADQDQDSVVELYSVPSDGSSPATKLNGPLVLGGDVDLATIDPSGARVVYLADQTQDFRAELYSAPIDGSASPVPLSDPASFVRRDFQLSSDGSLVVYQSFEPETSVSELHAVPIDGSAAPVRLAPGVEPDSTTSNVPFLVSPDGAWVVYRRQELNHIQLYSVPTSGGASVRLNGDLAANGNVYASTWPPFRVSPDSSWVVYRADQVADERFELFTVPIDGSAAAVRLNVPLGGTLDISIFFEVSPDSTHVVYVGEMASIADQLFSAPIDGSAPPVRLNGTLVINGNVEAFSPLNRPPFRISADSSRVLYRADQLFNQRFELFQVPLDGSAPATRVNPDLATGTDVSTQFEFSPDGNLAVYGVAQSTLETELFARTLDPLQTVRKLSGPLDGQFSLSPSGQRVIYRASPQGTRTDLFLSFTTRPLRRR